MPRGGIAAHTCGSLGAEALRPLRPAGALHPLRSFGDPATAAKDFAGTACAVDGDPAAVRTLEAFARAIGGIPLRVKKGRKELYHAGAVFASNYLVSILEAALRLFEAAGIGRRESTPVLMKLAQGTLNNIARVGIPRALTGPIERGDVATVRRQSRALPPGGPVWLANAALGEIAIDVAYDKGSLRGNQRLPLEAALSETAPPGRGKKAAVRP
jgi:predicted short-subunit dehydrogenase-like oxidoreductase (DUF2520 family)